MSKNSESSCNGPNNTICDDSFLFINRYDTQDFGRPQLPSRQMIGSHVQRSIHKNKRKRGTILQGYLATKKFSFQLRPKNITSNEWQGSRPPDPKLIGNKLIHSTKKSIDRQSPHFARQGDVEFQQGKEISPQLCSSTNTSEKQIKDSIGCLLGNVPQRLGCRSPERDGVADQQIDEKKSGYQKGQECLNARDHLPHHSVGRGGWVRFDPFYTSMPEFHDEIYSYLQQSYTFKMMEYTSPRSGIRWLQAQFQDAASMHGLSAASMAVAARLASGDRAKMELSINAQRHYIQSLTIAQRRIRNNERLAKLAYDTISLLVYTYTMDDSQSYYIHVSGIRHIVILLGGMKSVDPLLSLLLLISLSQGASQMLTRPVFRPTDWDRQSWYEDPELAESRHLFKVQRLALPSDGMMQSSTNRVLKDVQEFHSILAQYRLSDEILDALSNVCRWLNIRFFLLTQMIVNTYCDISEAKALGKYSNPHNNIGDLDQAFLVALLCCHQLLYYGQTNPSIIYSHCIPFYHVTSHLKKLKGNLGQLTRVSNPQELEMLAWISFVGACQDTLNDDYLIHGSKAPCWSSEFCRHVVISQHMSIGTVDDFRTQLAKILYCGSVLDPLLHRVWDLMLRREGHEMC